MNIKPPSPFGYTFIHLLTLAEEPRSFLMLPGGKTFTNRHQLTAA
jgi:hypothetical protein